MTTWRELRHQMRPRPLVWTRPLDDRPPYIVWVIGGAVVWPIILAIYLSANQSTQVITAHEAIWLIFFGWCIGVLGATCAHYFYRR